MSCVTWLCVCVGVCFHGHLDASLWSKCRYDGWWDRFVRGEVTVSGSLMDSCGLICQLWTEPLTEAWTHMHAPCCLKCPLFGCADTAIQLTNFSVTTSSDHWLLWSIIWLKCQLFSGLKLLKCVFASLLWFMPSYIYCIDILDCFAFINLSFCSVKMKLFYQNMSNNGCKLT